jgi:uncharacterized membrane protein YeaQ/YmgE (transglycosylase-associated protein family)
MPASLFLTLLQDRVVVVQYQQYERGLIGWIVIGLIAGWLAGKIARGAGYGCITDIILGLVGSVLGGWLFMKLGILGGGFLYSLAAATVGAIILVAIVHLFAGKFPLAYIGILAAHQRPSNSFSKCRGALQRDPASAQRAGHLFVGVQRSTPTCYYPNFRPDPNPQLPNL